MSGRWMVLVAALWLCPFEVAAADADLPWPPGTDGLLWAGPGALPALGVAGAAGPAGPPHGESWLDDARSCLRHFWKTCPPEPTRRPHGRPILAMALLFGLWAGLELGVDSPDDPRWSHVNGFDDDVRDALQGGSRSTRDSAGTASDALLIALGAGLAIDWWWLRREWAPGASVLTDTSWFIADQIATRTAKVSAGRERPLVDPCRVDGGYVDACDDDDDWNESFWSGHASTSATLAGLVCARHLSLADRDGWDWLVCGVSASAAVATGMLRITAEQHYMSDVLAGWATGALFGYVLPRVFDYRGEGGAFSRHSIAPLGHSGAFGLRYSVRF